MNNLKSCRGELRMTQLAVAKKAGIGEQQYQQYEYGKSEPGVRTAIRIAKALETTVEALFPLLPK